ncbi:MAG TPA: MATE family efflux transporter [Terriglobales bacterium]|nr:MATE family efflux transporter [Terriglobales bacterium]
MTESPASSLPSGVVRPIPGELLRLALPVLASQLLRVAYQWVDALWVQGLGVSAIAAVTSSVFVMWSVYSLNDMVAVGALAWVSQLLGSGNARGAGEAAFRAARASALLGLLGTIAALVAGRHLFGLMTTDPRVLRDGTRYLTIVLAAAPLPMIALTCESIMRASGDTRTPFLLDLCAVTLNAVLAPLLIYGPGPFPALGVAGAACATVSAQAALVAGYLVVGRRRGREAGGGTTLFIRPGAGEAPAAARSAPAAADVVPVPNPAAWAPRASLARLLAVGAPASLIGILFSVVYVAFARSAARFGPDSMAVIGIANRIEAIQFVTAASIGSAGAALVGQNLGAGQARRAAQVIRTGVVWNSWIALVVTGVIELFPSAFLFLFTRDPAVHQVGVPYLRILAVCFLPTAIEVVTTESVLGSGHTLVVSLIFTGISLARIPLAFLVPAWTHSALSGIAWVITTTCFVRTALILFYAARGSWQRGLGAGAVPG